MSDFEVTVGKTGGAFYFFRFV